MVHRAPQHARTAAALIVAAVRAAFAPIPVRSRDTIYVITCSAHDAGQLAISVEHAPAPGWSRLRWRVASRLDG
jgi:hypothetical protein